MSIFAKLVNDHKNDIKFVKDWKSFHNIHADNCLGLLRNRQGLQKSRKFGMFNLCLLADSVASHKPFDYLLHLGACKQALDFMIRAVKS